MTRRVFVVGGYIPRGGTYMAYHLALIFYRRFGNSVVVVDVNNFNAPTEMFDYAVPFESISLDSMERTAAIGDIHTAIAGRVFSLTGRPAVYVAERLGWYRVSPTMLSATHADPHKQIELARPQTAILVIVLRSRRLRAIHRAAGRRLGAAIGRSLATAVSTRKLRSVARAIVCILAGARDARRLSSRNRRSADA